MLTKNLLQFPQFFSVTSPLYVQSVHIAMCIYITSVFLLISTTHSIIITPSANDEFIEVQFNQNKNNYIKNDSWFIYDERTDTLNAWSIILKLKSNKYGFNEYDNKSTIIIEMNGTVLGNELDVFYSFSVNNKYFSFANDFDGRLDEGIIIYPSCDNSLLSIGNASLFMNDVTDYYTIRQNLADGSISNWDRVTTKK